MASGSFHRYINDVATTDITGLNSLWGAHLREATHMQRNTGDGDNRVTVLWVYSRDSLVDSKSHFQKTKNKERLCI